MPCPVVETGKLDKRAVSVRFPLLLLLLLQLLLHRRPRLAFDGAEHGRIEAGRGGSALLPGAAERWRGAGAGDFLRELRRGAGGFGSVEEPPLAVLCLDSKSASTDGLVTGTPRATWSLLPVLRLLLLLADPFAFATRAGSFSSSSTASGAGTSFSSVTPSAVAACFARARRY